ncbi:hypothetical protein T484DRAFT_1895986 [Baffinella frigidus]|nr:hypothetical protein T484DRAFT_1895986 [Cryptophyta sp. CCMP2293]
MDDESSPSNGAANFASSDHGAYAKYAHWDLSFDAGGKGGEAAKEQKELILECKGHCQQLLTLVSTDLLKFEHKQGPVDMSSKATVGIMLKGTVVDNLLMGGPAFASGLLSRGDVIISVDGQSATSEHVHLLLGGADVPGSPVSIRLRKHSGQEVDVNLKRMATEVDVMLKRMATVEIADKRRLFELFTAMKVL